MRRESKRAEFVLVAEGAVIAEDVAVLAEQAEPATITRDITDIETKLFRLIATCLPS